MVGPPTVSNCLAKILGIELVWLTVKRELACIPATKEFPTATNYVKSADPFEGVGGGSGVGVVGIIGSCLHDPTKKTVIRIIWRYLIFFISVVL